MDWAAIGGLILSLAAMALRAWRSRELVALRAELDESEGETEELRTDNSRLRRRLRALEADNEEALSKDEDGEDGR